MVEWLVRPATTPVAVIRWGTTSQQEIVFGTLADIAERAASIEPPAVVVIGKVVDLAGALSPAQKVEEYAA